MSWQGYSWILLKACGATDNQLLQLLMPFQGRFPATEQEFGALQLALRRMGHILERSSMNIATQLRTQPSRGVFYQQGDGQEGVEAQEVPWHQGPDPWSGASTDPWDNNHSQWRAGGPSTNTQATYFGNGQADAGSDTDTNTASTYGEPDHSDLQGLTPAQVDEQLYWT